MNTFVSDKPKNKVNLSQILGGIPGLLDETSFEMETPIQVSEVVKEVGNLFFEDILGLEQKTAANKLSIGGQTELKFNENQAKIEEEQKKKKEADRKKAFYQTLKDDQLRAQMAKDRMWMEEEINDITSNISTEDKNELLHYQANYKDRSIYQKAELRRKIIEQRRKSENQQKEVAIPSPAKQPSALEGAFEGRSGTQGSGTANLSAHATG